MRLNDPQRPLREQLRKFLSAGPEPLTPRLETGEEPPNTFMREMVAALGLTEGLDRTRAEDRGLARQAHMQLLVEIARINPGLGPSYEASGDPCAGNVSKLGTPEQIERYVMPLVRADKIGAWCLTEPRPAPMRFCR
jgi:alkylation response protein AidB-like acyl-CoA dehydrogenase